MVVPEHGDGVDLSSQETCELLLTRLFSWCSSLMTVNLSVGSDVMDGVGGGCAAGPFPGIHSGDR
ncbi:hypothetical protein HMPREF9153_1939 [Cutibacterium avidum ATCC 25577]|uniref:Uncharacterized protein n=1 Tax=Cutibacterium avidum ATCC 25577 TaxID=997355 RepID=G4CZR7_9ACTN|nr:hypothetical protein HMPREF9153_1939 [Cutibacterium avidum ATCC 25577]